jgi:hypothetical protein
MGGRGGGQRQHRRVDNADGQPLSATSAMGGSLIVHVPASPAPPGLSEAPWSKAVGRKHRKQGAGRGLLVPSSQLNETD